MIIISFYFPNINFEKNADAFYVHGYIKQLMAIKSYFNKKKINTHTKWFMECGIKRNKKMKL